MKKLFLLDAYALIYRAYYALMRSPRFTTGGLNTSAIFGFCNTLDEVLRKENPGYMAVCFDPRGGHTFRHEVYPEYKAQRDKQPEDITLAIPYIKRILEAYRIPVIEAEGYEADDVIGTLARRAEAGDFTTYMMTPDKDYGQLVTDRTLQYRPSLRGQGFEIRGPQEVCERYGISRPEQVIDLLALEGDASDNVPGCPGVGEKTASKLIAEWGSVENLLEHASELKGALRTKIETNAEQIRFSKFLVTIKTDVPVDVSPDDLVRHEPDVKALQAIFDELEFKTLAARLTARHGAAAAEAATRPAAPAGAPLQGSLFDEAGEATAEAAQAAEPEPVEVLDDPAAAAAFIADALKGAAVGIAAEADGDDAMRAVLHGLAVSAADGRTAYIALPPRGDARAEALTLLEPLLAGQATIVSHDVKRLMVITRRLGLSWSAPYFDTSVAHYLLAPETPHDLPTVAFAMLRRRTSDYGLSATERKKVRHATAAEAAAATGERASIARQLQPILTERLKADSLWQLYTDIEGPFIPVLASMEYEGVRIDTAELQRLSRKLTQRLADDEERAYAIAGERFNIGSPMQVGRILFEKLAIDANAKKTKRGAWSTTEEILEKLEPKHPIVGLILQIRGLRKLLATYVDALPALINPATGKIHTTYNQIVTATGRISSTNPNLQNIPVRTDDGREIRRAFIADEGDLLLSADYSQIELRLIADISGDPGMVDAFNAGADIHRATAAKIYHEELGDVTDEQRRNAKTANFGIIYGISAFGLSERLSIPRGEAKELIENYMRTYPKIKEYMEQSIARAREQGFVTTIHGRKRFLPEIGSRNAALRGYAERNAINAPLQGSAADIIKIAMIAIARRIEREGLRSRMIMQVHDELVFNVKPDELARVQELVVSEMEHAYSGRVTLEVSAGVGTNWLEAH